MNPLLRRTSALAAAALTAGALTLPAGAAQAATPLNAPAAAAVGWANAQLTDGGLPSSYGGTNTGATIDLATSLRSLDPAADVSAETSAIEAGLNAAYGYADADEYGCPTAGDWTCAPADQVLKQHGYYANATAKVLAYAESIGADATAFGGRDLVTQLEGLVQPDGSIEDDSYYGDYANVFGQAFAVRGLTAAGSADAASATTFLLDQQCPNGSFPEQFGACSGGSSVDATATVVQQLTAESAPSTDVTAAITQAAAWLASVQHANGAWSTDAAAQGDNANSTGLAGSALAATGNTGAATKAAAWVRAHQLAAVGSCTPGAANVGAIAFDDAALKTVAKDGTATDQFWIAASQALPVLAYAPAATGTLAISGPASMSDGPTNGGYTIRGAAPGETLCVTVNGAAPQAVTAGLDGTATVTAALKSGATNTVAVTSATATASMKTVVSTTLKVLDTPTRVQGPRKVHAGHVATYTIKGLKKGEKVTVKVRGKKVAQGKVKANGVFKVKVVFKGKLAKKGAAKLVAVGATSGKTVTVTIKVVR